MIILSGTGTLSGSFPDFPSIASEWGRWEAFRETGYTNGQQINPLTDWSGNTRHWSNTGTRPQYKENGLNGLAVADAATGGGASGWPTGPNMSALTAVHAFMVIKAQNDPAGNIFETIPWVVGTSGIASHIPYTNGLIYDDAFSNTRKDAQPKVTNMASSFVLYEIVSASSEWTRKINGATSGDDFFTTGTNTVSCPSAPELLTASRHELAGLYIFSAKLTTDRAAVISYLNDASIFNLGVS